MTQGKFQRKEKKFHPPSHISKRPFLEIDQKDFQFKILNHFSFWKYDSQNSS